MKHLDSTWDRDATLLHSRLVGCVTVDDVATWQASLRVATDAIPTGTRFKLLFDLHGYEPAALDAHRAMREVIPRLLLHTRARRRAASCTSATCRAAAPDQAAHCPTPTGP
jgi:hypothetical protein